MLSKYEFKKASRKLEKAMGILDVNPTNYENEYIKYQKKYLQHTRRAGDAEQTGME
tara:strand:+ start:420 stop:587 length:168 start_codon:yes stop_codon:yes gene_type:complete